MALPFEAPRRVTLSELTRGVCGSMGAIDRRTWEVRARVTFVNEMTVKWGCRSCGCDAGSMGATAAAAAAAAHHHGVSGGGGGGGGSHMDNLAGCPACRPSSVGGRSFASPAAAAAAAAACGFEAEVSVTIDDGSSQAYCKINGAAGAALLPPCLKAAALALARRHGRVTATLLQMAGAEQPGGGGGSSFSGHVLRGYASLSMGEVEGAPVLAAVGHAQSLGEMLLRVQLDYKNYEPEPQDDAGTVAGTDAGTGAGTVAPTAAFGAASAPAPPFRKVTLQGEPTWMHCAPHARLRALAVAPVEPAREAAAVLGFRV
jgi:hypothetical protein